VYNKHQWCGRMTTLLGRFPRHRSLPVVPSPVVYLSKNNRLLKQAFPTFQANFATKFCRFASWNTSYALNHSWIYQEQKILSCQYHHTASKMASSPRTRLSDRVQAAKEEYLNMELDSKRSLYKCGDKFVTLEKISNWISYSKSANVEVLDDIKGKCSVDEALNSKVSLWQGDITVLEIDAIVNAANSSLLGGGGVDGAIHRAAGPKLLSECEELRGCPTGQAKITGGYKLPSKHVIHTVGPQGEKPEALRSCYVNSLQLMLENNLRSIAFPCIATGIYGYPRDRAANVALTTVRKFLEENSEKVDRVIFTVFLEEDKQVYEELMQKYFPIE